MNDIHTMTEGEARAAYISLVEKLEAFAGRMEKRERECEDRRHYDFASTYHDVAGEIRTMLDPAKPDRDFDAACQDAARRAKYQITKHKIVQKCEELIDKNLVWSIKPNDRYMACDIESRLGHGSIYATANGIESNFEFEDSGASAKQLANQIDRVKAELQEQFDKCAEMLRENAKETKQKKKSIFRHRNDDYER